MIPVYIALAVLTALLIAGYLKMAGSVADLDAKLTTAEATVAALPASIDAKVAAAVAAAVAEIPTPDLSAEIARVDALDAAVKQAVA